MIFPSTTHNPTNRKCVPHQLEEGLLYASRNQKPKAIDVEVIEDVGNTPDAGCLYMDIRKIRTR